MKVLISADMEGTCGVVSWTQVMPPEVVGGSEPVSQDRYLRTRQRMTAEVNAAVEGALAGGADEVIVNDSHDGMRNLIPDELHPAVRFITGSDKPLGMVQGVDLEGIGALFYTGYHAKAGTPAAPLAHTWSGWLSDVRLDGVSTGEFGINAVVAGYYGIPVVLVTGDIRAVAQTQAFLGDQVVGAVVKEGISTFSALHLHPLKAQELIREAAETAMGRVSDARPFTMEVGATVELAFDHQARADHAVLVPGVVRTGERAIAWIPLNGLEFIRTFSAVMLCAGIRMSP
ncbi:MAG: M55 family metallopeptidase [Chloroflexota bacterium]|nr:M55 family metallopeptidase [Chloroflexota bacterium]